jgi:DNA-binding protein H-NS
MADVVNRHVDELTIEDKIADVMQIIETLDYPELWRLRELIDGEYKKKAVAARKTVIAETQRKFEQLGLSFDDVVGMQRKKKRAARTPAVPKYRSPVGREWSGRGPTPKWIRELEEAGGNREDFLINEEG